MTTIKTITPITIITTTITSVELSNHSGTQDAANGTSTSC